jgi:CHAD domain-containing protein
VTVEASAAEFLSRHLAALDLEVPGVLLRVSRQSDAEAIHDLRVTIRRLRTLLRLARPVFGRHHCDFIRGVYTDVARSSGALRDEEVFLELLEKHGAGIEPALAAELQAFEEERRVRERALRGALLKPLETDHISRARTTLGALLTLPVRPKKDRELARFGRAAVMDALAGVDEHRDAKSDDVAALHRLRIAYTRLRYTLEFFGPVLPPDLTAAHVAADRYHTRLGDVHDLDMALVHCDESPRLSRELRDRLAHSFRESRAKKIGAFEAEMRPHGARTSPLVR